MMLETIQCIVMMWLVVLKCAYIVTDKLSAAVVHDNFGIAFSDVLALYKMSFTIVREVHDIS